MPRVLIADKLADVAAGILTQAGMEVDAKTGRDEAEILADIADYEAMVVPRRGLTERVRQFNHAAKPNFVPLLNEFDPCDCQLQAGDSEFQTGRLAREAVGIENVGKKALTRMDGP